MKPIFSPAPLNARALTVALLLAGGCIALAPIPYAFAKDAPVKSFDATLDKSLMSAIYKNDAREVRKLLGRRASPNAHEPDSTGMTALGQAADMGSVELIKMLVAAGADMENGNALSQTPLLLATLNNRTETITALVQSGAKIDSTRGGMTALMLATISGHTDSVRTLLRLGANVNAHDANTSRTALLYGVSNFLKQTNLETIRLLVEAGADLFITDADGKNVYLTAQDKDLDDIARYLYEARKPHLELIGASSEAAGLSDGVFPNAWSDARRLLNAGAKGYATNKSGETALILFSLDAKGFDESIAKRLIAVSDVNARSIHDVCALDAAVQSGNEKMLALLIAAGAKASVADKNGYTPLDRAQPFPAIVTMLRNAGAQSGKTTIAAATPATPSQSNAGDALFAALMGGAFDTKTETPPPAPAKAVTSMALAAPKAPALAANSVAKGPLDELDERQHTPLMSAALDGNADKVAQLLKQGATVDIANNMKETALFMAAYGKNTAAVKMLIEAGADINHRGARGTILLANAFNGSVPVMQMLIEAGIDRGDIKSAIQQAKDGENQPLVTYFSNLPAPKAATPTDNPTKMPVAANVPAPNAAVAAPQNTPNPVKIAGDYATTTAPLLTVLQGPKFDATAAAAFLRAGADIQRADAQGQTPLMVACANGSVEAVKWLLSQTVALDATDARGMTALMHAAGRSDDSMALKVVTELLQTDASYKLKNKDRKTALDLAKAKGNDNAAFMIDLAISLD